MRSTTHPQRIPVQVAAENPGQCALHCHNTYNAEGGILTTLLSYAT